MKRIIHTLLFVAGFLSISAQPIHTPQTLTPGDPEDMDIFGEEVALAGDFAFITAKGDRTKGSTYVFQRQEANDSWTQLQKFTPDTNNSGNGFGNAVAMTENLAVVGFWYDDVYATGSGSAMVYANNNGTWEFQQKLVPDTGEYNDRFGMSVAIHNDLIIVGTSAESGGGNYGAAYIFQQENEIWTLQQRITASNPDFANDYGGEVAMHEDFAFVGASHVDDQGINSGAVYVYKRNGNTWTETDILYASDAINASYFGSSISVDDDWMAISAPQAGDSVSFRPGKVYTFKRNNDTWEEQQILFASDGEDDDRFGYDVALSCNYISVGAIYENDSGLNNGAAYLFEYQEASDSWTEIEKTTGPEGGGLLGISVALSCRNSLVGASHHYINGPNSGLAYMFSDPDYEFPLLADEAETANEVSIYPNPTDGVVFFKNPSAKRGQIEVYSLDGRRIQSRAIRSHTQIDFSLNPNGVYLLSWKGEDGSSQVFRIICHK